MIGSPGEDDAHGVRLFQKCHGTFTFCAHIVAVASLLVVSRSYGALNVFFRHVVEYFPETLRQFFTIVERKEGIDVIYLFSFQTFHIVSNHFAVTCHYRAVQRVVGAF